MEDSQGKSELRKIAEVLRAYQVEFIVVGGQAESLMGSPRVTYDVDVCYNRTQLNLERMAAALKELKVKLRGVPEDVPFIIDGRSLLLGSNFTFRTPFVDFDLLGYVEPIGGFDELLKRAEQFQVGEIPVLTISLDDLIKVKQHIRRSKDQDSLYQLLAIKRIREEGK